MSLIKLRSRLGTIKSLHSIFAALQVVTVVRTQRIREKYRALERYLAPMKDALRGRGLIGTKGLIGTGDRVLIVITSNRGLCGNFNKAVVSEAEKFMEQNPEAKIVALGKLGANLLGHRFPPAETAHRLVEKPTFLQTALFLQELLAKAGEVQVAYNSYRSTISQVPKLVKLAPQPAELESTEEPADYIFEPDRQGVVASLYDHYLAVKLYQLVLESQMGELGARLMVLKGAVDTSKDMAGDIQLSINKARQSVITRELLEIVSAAEAVRESYE